MKKFMRTRSAASAPAPAPPLLNGSARALAAPNGACAGAGRRLDEQRSTVGRWRAGAAVAGMASVASAASVAGVAGGALWEDPEFPAAPRSLAERRPARADWLRPHELCANPRFMGDESVEAELPAGQAEPEDDDAAAARWGAEAGAAGDAHVRAAAAALALTPRLLARAVPPHSFRTGYCGRFRFRFWVFGVWREVAVDDRLPARAGRLVASHAAGDDFTLPLLEKAYAKLHGSYAALRGGSVARALQELSGGVVQSFAPPRQPRALLLRVLRSAVPRSTLLVATPAPGKPSPHARPLVPARAYVVTGLARAADDDEALVRLRAPHAPSHWRVPQEPDGVFWMPFSEFARSFARLELVHVGPDDWLAEPALHGRRPWRAVLARRRWRRGYNAGGPPRCRDTAHANPQFHVSVPRSDAAECHVVVSVTQQYTVGGARERLRGVGFAVYELPPGAAPRRAALSAAALAALRALDVTHESRAREVVTFFTLPPGQYLVVPHMHRAHAEAAFLLRILTDDHTDVWEVNDDNVIIRDIAAEFADEGYAIPMEMQKAVVKLLGKQDMEEVDAAALRALLRRVWRWCLPARPSLELCRALVMLRDAAICGRMPAADLPALLALLAFWRAALRRAGAAGCGARLSAYGLRALLWACGVSASNKVLECLVLRFARGAVLPPEAAVLALARLHLAHERYRSLDTKMKSNPLSLEEMILMTIYS